MESTCFRTQYTHRIRSVFQQSNIEINGNIFRRRGFVFPSAVTKKREEEEEGGKGERGIRKKIVERNERIGYLAGLVLLVINYLMRAPGLSPVISINSSSVKCNPNPWTNPPST